VNWGSWDQFWAMGGHAFFVWGSYALTAACMLAEPVLVALRHARARARARQDLDENDA
jgi:heme exporter protein D